MRQQTWKVVKTGLNTQPLVDKLVSRPDLWGKWAHRQNYQGSAHQQADQIVLRWQRARSLEAAFLSLDVVDTPLMDEFGHELNGLLLELVDAVGEVGQIGRVMITRLPPGGRIAPHVDEGRYADYFDRFHVCLAGGAGNRFHCGQTSWIPVPGTAFWFNHKLMHSVENGCAEERLHLIVDLQAPEYRAMRGIYYQAELGMDVIEEATELDLFEKHYQEIARYKDIPLDPDLDVYEGAEAGGMLRCFTMRDCGELVGYALYFVKAHPHYKGSKVATQDVLYVHPAYRKGFAGIRLIRMADERLAAEGVQVVTQHVKTYADFGRVLERLGYEAVETIYMRRLDKKGDLS